jgi:nitrogen fixation/metabolism regulation signal transduction histidine kinase
MMPRFQLRIRFEQRLFFSALAVGLPGVILSIFLLWANPYSIAKRVEASVGVLALWIVLSMLLHKGVVRAMQMLSGVVASPGAEGLSFQSMVVAEGDIFGDISLEINNLMRLMERERSKAVEIGNLLRNVASEIEAVILDFDSQRKVRWLNRAGLSFLGKEEKGILGNTATELGIDNLLDGDPSETISHFCGGIEKRWIVRRTEFQENGAHHRLVVLSDASDALRAEERLAWQRLVRVLSHEVNNSLAPVKSIVRTLTRIADSQLPEGVRENFRHGLDVIGSRAEALNRFLQGYTYLMRLPPPKRRLVAVKQLVERVAELEMRLKVEVDCGLDATIRVDPDQLEQALINLIRNAADAVLSLPQSEALSNLVTITWSATGDQLDLRIRDFGIGLLDTSNLFVPFYTTKETGTGIGLLLSRQIIEAHGGKLMIHGRKAPRGCDVEIRIPACIVDNGPAPGSESPAAVALSL